MSFESNPPIDRESLLAWTDAPLPLSHVLLNEELQTRPSKEPRYKEESEALVRLSKALLGSADEILYAVSREAMQLCGGTSAGISLKDHEQGQDIFRWHSLVGELAPFEKGTMPRDFSPCGVVVDENSHQLFSAPIRHYPYITQLGIPLHEVLLVPFSQGDDVMGTLWVVAHTPEKKFDREDLRLLTSISYFTGAAVQMAQQTSKLTNSVAEIEKREKALAFEEHKLAAVFHESPAAMALWQGKDLIFEKVNPAYADIFPGRELVGRPLIEAVPELKGQPFVKLLEDVMATGVPFVGKEIVAQIQKEPGGPLIDHYYDFSYVRVTDAEGVPYGVYDHAVDVTEKVLARKALEEKEALLRSEQERLTNAIAVSKIGFYNWDIVTNEVTCSEQMQKEWGLPQGALPLEKIVEYIHPEDRDICNLLIQNAIDSGSHFKAEYRVVRPDGSLIWVEAQGKVSCSPENVPLRFFGTTINISDRKKILLDLEAASIEAERANQAKSAFLANMSHEIRTPLGAIMGFAELLTSPETTSEDLESYSSVILRNSEHLMRIIDDILDLSKVEAGKMLIENIPFSLAQLLGDFSSLMGLKARDKGIIFSTQAVTPLPESVVGDPTRLRQILSNVVGNALKFTEHGQVQLLIAYAAGKLEMRVLDTGVGLTAEQADQLFKPFQQADASVTRKFGGTGLGLTLTRALAVALGGSFVLEKTVPGEGSIFTVQIKVDPVVDTSYVGTSDLYFSTDGPRRHTQDARRLVGLRVLVVEDTLDNQVLIRQLLSRAGAKAHIVTHAEEGIEEAFANSYDVILMDIQMPGMDGHTATRILRSRGYTKPIFALTAHAMKDEREKGLASGFTDFLTKPISRDLLFEALGQYRQIIR